MEIKKRTKQSKKQSKRNYIDNKKFLNALIERKKAIDNNNGVPIPISDEIAKFLLLITDRLTNHRRYIGYTPNWKEEMRGDAIINLLKCIDNFDTTKYKNPFTYFTTVTYWAFMRRVTRELGETYTKYKSFFDSEWIEDKEILTMMQNNDSFSEQKLDFIDNFEKYINEKKLKNKSKNKLYYKKNTKCQQ